VSIATFWLLLLTHWLAVRKCIKSLNFGEASEGPNGLDNKPFEVSVKEEPEEEEEEEERSEKGEHEESCAAKGDADENSSECEEEDKDWEL